MKDVIISKIKKIILSVILLIILIIVLAYLWMGKTQRAFEEASNVIRNSKDDNGNLINPININKEKRCLEINEDLFSKLQEKIQNLNVDMDTSKLGNDLSYLRTFIEAEASTLYPDLRSYEEISKNEDIPTGELQGKLKIKRAKENGKVDYISYITPEEFDKLTNKDASWEEQKKSLNYFTINDENDLVLANWSMNSKEVEDSRNPDHKEKNQEYKIVIQKVNYQSIIKKYSMPFEIPLCMLLISQNPEFSLGIANLALNTQMTITIQDNTTKTVTKTVETSKGYSRQERNYQITMIDAGVTQNQGEVTVNIPKNDFDYVVTTTEETDNNVMNIELSYVDSWFTKIETDYTYKEDETTKVNTTRNPESGDPEETKNDSDTEITNAIEIMKDTNVITAQDEMIKKYMEVNQANMTFEKDEGLRNQLSIAIEQEIERRAKLYVSEQYGNSPAEEQATQLENKKQELHNNEYDNIKNELYDTIRENYYKSIIIAQIDKILVKNYNSLLQERVETITVNENKYVENPVRVESNEDRFLGLIQNSTGKYEKLYNDDGTENKNALYNKDGELVEYNVNGKKESPKQNIMSASSMMYNLIRTNKYISEYESNIKYLMYVLNKKDEEETIKNGLSVYDESKFENLSDTRFGILLEYIKSWKNSLLWTNDDYSIGKYITEDKKNYIIYNDDSDLYNKFGYGMNLYNMDSNKKVYNYINEFKERNIDVRSLKDGDLIDKETCDILFEEQIYKVRNEVIAQTVELNLTNNQIDALTFILYDYDSLGNFIDVYNQYGNSEQLKENFIINNEKPFKRINSEWGIRSSKANWKLFNEGIYTSGIGSILTYSNVNLITKKAEEIQKYLKLNEYEYSVSKLQIPVDNNEVKTINNIAYVQWVLYESGISKLKGQQLDINDFKKNKYSWQVISLENIQSGDIIVYDNSLDIFSNYSVDGKMEVYSVESDASIKGKPTSVTSHNNNEILAILRPTI